MFDGGFFLCFDSICFIPFEWSSGLLADKQKGIAIKQVVFLWQLIRGQLEAVHNGELSYVLLKC